VTVDAQSLIACWELGRRRHPLDRALLLYAAAAPEENPDSLADRPLGRRNAALLELRRSLFGDALKSCVDCPECGERLEFTLSADVLLERAASHALTHAQLGAMRLRLPTTRDLASVAAETEETLAARKLLERLVDTLPVESGFSDEELTRALDAADPCLDLTLDLSCPACNHAWSAPFDVPAYLWEEIDARARRLLDEVHALARTYCWSEEQILALSEVRRRAYLDRVLA
jgi:hypothetical protein